jgi:hypothetical protein
MNVESLQHFRVLSTVFSLFREPSLSPPWSVKAFFITLMFRLSETFASAGWGFGQKTEISIEGRVYFPTQSASFIKL